ncbi:MAG: 2-oxoacid:acceptor oxidoreductase subunit alpha [Acidobacteria bacterium]|nr:2-oxoacid:acceptor oxidoreductase subunit alpha [Candidatus Sulfomarinibacter sp. MAG AM1]
MNRPAESIELTALYLAGMAEQEHFIQGDEAAALGAIFAGCTFFGGYPITPASEIAEVMARELPNVGGYYVQFEDELASISAVIGAAWAGARAMTATSGPGFSLMQENIGYACMTETPCVIINVQRSGPSTGQATLPAQGDVMQARWGTHGDHEIIALAPSSAQEAFDLVIRSFNLAEEYRTPVILLMDGEIGHLRERVILPDPGTVEQTQRKKAHEGEDVFGGATVPPMTEFGDGGFVHVTGSTHKEDGLRDVQTQSVHDRLVRRLVAKIEGAREEIALVDVDSEEDAEVGVLAYGATARPAKGAVLRARSEGRCVSFCRPVTIWPFPISRIQEACRGLRQLLVPEMNLGQLAREVERFVDCEVVPLSKIGGVVHSSQEIHAAIVEAIDSC